MCYTRSKSKNPQVSLKDNHNFVSFNGDAFKTLGYFSFFSLWLWQSLSRPIFIGMDIYPRIYFVIYPNVPVIQGWAVHCYCKFLMQFYSFPESFLVYILFPSVLSYTKISLKPHKKLGLIYFLWEKSKPSLTFNPGLALTAFRTTGPG